MPKGTLSTDKLQASHPTEYTSSSQNISAPIFNAGANLTRAANTIVPEPNNPSSYQQAQSLSQVNNHDHSEARKVNTGLDDYDQYKNKSLGRSLINALIKNYGKAINSTAAEVVRNVITEANGKGKNIDLENFTSEDMIKKLQENPEQINKFFSNEIRSLPTIIYETFFDSFPARMITDLGVGVIIPLANKLGLMKIIPEDVLQGIIATPVNLSSRALTNSKNQQTIQSGHGKKTEKEQRIIREYDEKPGWLVTFFNKLSTDGIKYIKKPLNKFLEFAFGIKAPGKVRGSDGTVLKDKNGKELIYSAKVNPFHLLSGIAGSIGLTFLISDKSEAPTGFGQVTSPFKAMTTLFIHVIARIHTDLFGKMGMLTNGKSFSYILQNSTFKKLPGPFSQYVADAAASSMRESGLAKKIGTVPLSLFMRMGVEVFQPLFTQGIFMIKKDNRIPDEYKYIGHKLIKPLINILDKGMKPLFKGVFKYFYAPLTGLYRPIIDKETGRDLMYEELTEEENQKAGFTPTGVPEDIKHLDEKYDSARSKAGLIFKSILKVPQTLFDAFKEANSLTDSHNKEMNIIKAKYDERLAALREAKEREEKENEGIQSKEIATTPS